MRSAVAREFSLRPATIEWAAAETIVAIGGMPVATASPYDGQTGVTDTFANVQQIGSIFAPDLENLQALTPDLIFCANWQQSLVPMLQRIAPVHVFDLRSSPELVDNTFRLVDDIGQIIDRQEGARNYRRKGQMELDAMRERLLPLDMPPILLGALVPDGRHISVFGSGSLFDGVLQQLGLKNAWTGPMNAWGNITQGIEVLADYPDVLFLYLDAGSSTVAARLALGSSSLWNALPSVRNGNVRPLPFAWLYGGLPTVLGFGRSLVAALA
ncbi:iron ABC transporter substrate-binding protein (plasmid) [Neorhizobium sp. NCHU2750]|nr:iron ABC transporter substrate-binding protein [Neorhizobium sp. NCHU2750]